jgi:sigma-B regulation protein RsbU (phosphoserine phosphatase)
VVTGTPLGVFDGARYPQVELKLNKGDMVLLFSDALTESQIADGKLRGENGLLALVKQLDHRSPQQFLHALIDAISGQQQNRAFDDDVTAVLVRATGTTTRWRDNLLAIFRLLGPVGDNTLLGVEGS